MRITFLILISILPVIILLWYFEKQDKGKKEPLSLKWKIFKWGIMATIFAAIIEVGIDMAIIGFFAETSWAYIFLTSFVTAAVTEEALKLWVVKEHASGKTEFDEIMDGISYTIIASLGFAALENILYVIQGGFLVGVLRASLSVPAHALFSGVMGYYIGKAHFTADKSRSKKLLLKGFLLGVLYHGLFNFFLFTGTMLVFLVIPLIAVMGLHLKILIKQARFEDKVDKLAPKPFTLKRIIKTVFTSFLIAGGVISLVASMAVAFFGPQIMAETPGQTVYTEETHLGVVVFWGITGLILLVISYFVIRNSPQNSQQNTT